ncbi:MAG: hypothetical protein R3F55_25855 [Alphaproteobacteria bacterium]
MTRLPATVAAAGLAAALLTAAAPQQLDGWEGRSWQAYSSIAMAITGDITTTPTAIVFGNGASLAVQAVQQGVPGLWGFESAPGPATVLQVVPPANPVLLEGNTLCGMQPTYITLAVVADGSLAMTVYGGSAVPTSSQSDDVCAIYYYGPM